MKKIYIFFALFLLINAGCEDFLDRENYTQMDENDVFKTVENAQGALFGVYDRLSDNEFYGRQVYAYEASKGPDFYVENSGSRFEKENGYDESASSAGYALDTWKKYYSTLKSIILIVDGIDGAEGDDDDRARIKGEALALRGLTYFELMRAFAYPPIFSFPGKAKYEEKYKWGVPVVLTGADLKRVENEPEGRKDAQYCYEEVIVKDLIAARNLLKEHGNTEQKYISYAAVCGLLSRVYIYMEKWTEAKEAALEGIAASKAKMIDYKEYVNMYYKSFNSENIWELEYTETDNLSTNSLNYIVRYQTIDKPGDPKDGKVDKEVGYAGYFLQQNWIDLVKATSEDVRIYLKCLSKDGKPSCRKYIGTPHYLHDIPLVRLPELYLNLAEACAELNDSGVKEALNAVYENRMGEECDITGLNKEELINLILKERRKELILEGHNFWDLFRRAIPFNREANGCIDNNVSHIDYTQPQVVYPIPEQEMDANPAIRNQQNPGYANYIVS